MQKLAIIGSIASIIGLLVAFIPPNSQSEVENNSTNTNTKVEIKNRDVKNSQVIGTVEGDVHFHLKGKDGNVQLNPKNTKARDLVFSSSDYEVGDIVSNLGKGNIIVSINRGRALNSNSSTPATISFDDIALSGKFEVNVGLKVRHPGAEVFVTFWDGGKRLTQVRYHRLYVTFAGKKERMTSNGGKWRGDGSGITMKFEPNAVKFYLNGKFFSVQETKFNQLTKVTITGLKREKDFLFSASSSPI